MFVEDSNSEELEYEYHRLMGIAEAFTGAEKLRQLPICSESVYKLYKFIQQEQEMRDLTPHTLEDMKKRIDKAIERDDYYSDRI